MALPRSIHVLVTAILIAMVPWCCCGLGIGSCCAAESATHAESGGDAGLPSCCRHGACHDKGRSDSAPAPGKSPTKECGSACCGPKAPPTPIHLDFKVDTVGAPMLVPSFDLAACIRFVPPADHPDWSRPPGASSGRETLRAHCVLLT